MQKLIMVLAVLLCFSCTSNKKTTLISNENGNIIWADGHNEKFYMPASKNTVAFIAGEDLVVYSRFAIHKVQGCDYFFINRAQLKLCEDGEAVLFVDRKIVNSGYANFHNTYN